MLYLTDRVAVVTGAASGIGLGLVEKFLAEGMKVVLADIDAEALDRTVERLQGGGHDVIGVITDVSKREQVEALAQATLDRYGAVHILCNNAGVAIEGSPVFEYTAKDWEWVLGVNQWGVIWGMLTFLPIMRAQDTECHIVNTSSLVGLLMGGGMYGTAKHAVVALSESYHCDLKAVGSKVGVSVLLPGVTRTNISQSVRLRPAGPDAPPLPAPTAEALRMAEALVEGDYLHAQPPSLLAEKVVDCIRKGWFWIVPNERYRQPAISRVEAAFEGGNPIPWSESMPGWPGTGW